MIRKQAGQVLVAGFVGLAPGATLLRRAAAGELGGFILFKRNACPVPELAERNRELIAAFPQATPPLMVVDQEGGRVRRLGEPVLQLPPMRALGRRADLALTQTVARVHAAQLRALGFSLNTAPVLDVDTNPDNPVIGDRSFSRTPEAVIAQALALARGMAEAGLASCGKHFPGHGDTDLDSHLALPRVRHPRGRLEQVEFAPFAALATELPAMMTSHVVFEVVDPERPATLSPDIATTLLRDHFGFSGLLLSDDMEMGALAAYGDAGATAVAAIAAGCDQLLMCKEEERFEAAYDALVRRAEADPEFANRLAQAAERSLQLRRRYVPEVTASTASEQAFARESEALQERLTECA